MDKNYRKLKILYYGSICCTYHQLKFACTNRSKKEKEKMPTFGKWRFRGKEVKRMGHQQKRIRQKEQQD